MLQHQPNTQPQHKGQRSLLQIAMAESAIKTTMPKCNNKWHTSRTRSTQSLKAYRQPLPTYEMIVNNKAIPPCAHRPRSKLLGYFFYFVICIFRAFNHPETKTPFKQYIPTRSSVCNRQLPAPVSLRRGLPMFSVQPSDITKGTEQQAVVVNAARMGLRAIRAGMQMLQQSLCYGHLPSSSVQRHPHTVTHPGKLLKHSSPLS